MVPSRCLLYVRLIGNTNFPIAYIFGMDIHEFQKRRFL